MQNEAVLILDKEDIENRLTRLAYQIYEENFSESEIILCGIEGRGYVLTEKIAACLSGISPIKVSLLKIGIDKENPTEEARLEPQMQLAGKVVILCDDVLYTGRTMAYATIPLLESGARKLQCLTLIDRNHLAFPVKPAFTGLSLATTLQERVEVDFESGKVWLKE